MSVDPNFDAGRFLDAQKQSYARALEELRYGQKRTHWMWFVFPQLAGLGHSATALHFAFRSADEARAYLAHPILGERIRAATQAVLVHTNRSLAEIFGHPDDLKFRSSMTLFAAIAAENDGGLFRQALDVFCDGETDPATLRLLVD
ncbi:MAG: DUF1810 domain-containing protein [Rhizobium sp.]|nr:DUF1810 domain-containing protein [Rhizobium sp.]